MRRILYLLLVLIILSGLYSAVAFAKGLPALQPVSTLSAEFTPTKPDLPWPSYGETAVGAAGYGTLATSGDQKALPTASVAKVMTALAVLRKKPLHQGQQGPTLKLTQQDADYYNSDVAAGGSVVPVNVGEQISEYQALQAMLLPSGNNIAKTLAVWAFGSEQAYVVYANNYAMQLGMASSHFADASGFSSSTVSTASDLVTLGSTAIKNPALAEIVGQTEATVPVAGVVHNVNTLIGQDGINGIKTGNTDQAGGVFLASKSYTVAGHHLTAITAVMGASNLHRAMSDSVPLLDATQNNFTEQTVVKAGDVVGYYNTPWHTSTNAVATSDFKTFGWKGNPPKLTLSLQPVHVPLKAKQPIGTLTFRTSDGTTQQATVVTSSAVAGPSWKWRLAHP